MNTLKTIHNVSADDLVAFNPECFDARANGDGTYDMVPVRWTDDASYASYQGDDFSDEDNYEEYVEQLVSSDGAVIAEKDDGKWIDVKETEEEKAEWKDCCVRHGVWETSGLPF